eukprot:6473414-Pyramimonas_sp.AAC.1
MSYSFVGLTHVLLIRRLTRVLLSPPYPNTGAVRADGGHGGHEAGVLLMSYCLMSTGAARADGGHGGHEAGVADGSAGDPPQRGPGAEAEADVRVPRAWVQGVHVRAACE